MRKILLLTILVLLCSIAFAETINITVSGKVTGPNGETTPTAYVDVMLDGEHLNMGQDAASNGSFTLSNIPFDTEKRLELYTTGECYNNYVYITYDNGTFVSEVNGDEEATRQETTSTTIDLGNIINKTSGRLVTYSDVTSTREFVGITNIGGGGNLNFLNKHESWSALRQNEDYSIEWTDEDGERYSTTFTSNNTYCATTQIVKDGDNYTTEYCQNNACSEPTIGQVTTNVGTYNKMNQTLTINVRKGWNTVPIGFTNSDTCNLKAWWIWTPTVSKYIGGLPNTQPSTADMTIINNDVQNMYLYIQSGGSFRGGMWSYSENDCVIQNQLHASTSDNDTINQLKLAKGWNFVTVTPWMVDKKFSSFMGSCELEMVATWSAEMQNWSTTNADLMSLAATQINDGTDSKIYEGSIGTVALLKTNADCTLGNTTNVTAPPTLPGDNEPTQDESIIGVWYTMSGDERVEMTFNTDGSYTGLVYPDATSQTSVRGGAGSYTTNGSNLILTSGTVDQLYTWSIQGNELTMTYQQSGDTHTYTKKS